MSIKCVPDEKMTKLQKELKTTVLDIVSRECVRTTNAALIEFNKFIERDNGIDQKDFMLYWGTFITVMNLSIIEIVAQFTQNFDDSEITFLSLFEDTVEAAKLMTGQNQVERKGFNKNGINISTVRTK